MQLIKGESAFWINRNNLCVGIFGWQDEYFVVGVCESMLENSRNYIAKQEIYHRTKSFDDEFEEFLKRAGFEKFKDEES